MFSIEKVVLFSRFVAIFGKKYGTFSPKIFGRNFLLSKSVFGYFKTNKLFFTKLEGGGG